MPPADNHSEQPLEQAFADFVARRQTGEAIDLEAFCRENPDLAGAIRRRWEEWQRVVRVFEKLEARTELSAWMEAQFGRAVDPGITLAHDREDRPHSGAKTLYDRLQDCRPRRSRYRLTHEIARGGMGVVLKVWDEDLRRNAAMKVMLGVTGARAGERRGASETAALERFLEEAQITSQLDHPGVVPVHELGLDPNGHVYFTMRYVKGRNLSEIFQLVRSGEEGWTLARALGMIIKVCEAVAYAHSKDVIHRDLKPSNIMVGRFGETYVMDWGLAKVTGRRDTRDIRVRREGESAATVIATDRREREAETPDSPLLTVDGHVLGTPAYMPPEQAEGKIDEIGTHSDIYSIGAMLYQLLSGQMPYVPKSAKVPPHAVLGMVMAGRPRPIHEIDPHAPEELVAICDKAMARNPAGRYASAMEMARDIENYLDRRPVGARPPSVTYLFKLFLQRNRPVAMTVGAALLVVITLLGFFISNLQDALETAEGALQDKQRAYDRIEAPRLVAEAGELYPCLPTMVERMTQWIERADQVLAKRALYEREFRDLEAQGAGTQLEELGAMVKDLAALTELRPRVAANLEVARNLARRTIDNEAESWDDAIGDIAELEAYRGLELSPQLGLVPLDRNPHSQLWEFWHVLSGERPVLDEGRGEASLREESGIVLVLLPGGPFIMGADETDPERESNERPHRVVLEPFFISKYEVTQAQWQRVMGENPSLMEAGTEYEGEKFTWLNPVETVTWFECQRFADRLDLSLPTEAQWEYACRAGTRSPFCWGATQEALAGKENVGDRTFARAIGLPTTTTWADGHVHHAPVGSFEANPFGLHDMHGNVGEWCADWELQDYPPDSDVPGDGLMPGGLSWRRASRGGSWYAVPRFCRAAFRGVISPYSTNFSQGVRLVRRLRLQND
ncbi:MAG: bifunctional serine/threonine-protein kinase/formylglycine-generating enzyme family protein [Planctomycetota bacterium]